MRFWNLGSDYKFIGEGLFIGFGIFYCFIICGLMDIGFIRKLYLDEKDEKYRFRNSIV